MDATALTTALTSIQTLVTNAVTVISGNDLLMIMFCGGMLGIGFRIIRQAKGASR